VADIDVGTVALEGESLFESALQAEPWPTEIGDYDEDGIPDLMVKFDRSAVQELADVGENVELTVFGKWGEVPFRGSDDIRVIDPGEERPEGGKPEEHPSKGRGPPRVPPGHGGEPPGRAKGRNK
jgi:hypothetical protein